MHIGDKEYEHKVYDKGKNIGLLVIDTTKIEGVDMWQRLDRLMVEYSKLHPNELRIHLYENQAIRRNLYNDYAANKKMEYRHGASLPPGLYMYIMRMYPEIFEQKSLFHKFIKRYRGFAIAKKI